MFQLCSRRLLIEQLVRVDHIFITVFLCYSQDGVVATNFA